jgi:hypothetical protein
MQLKSLLFLILVPILFTGCGGGNSGNQHVQAVSKSAASSGCLNCHDKVASPATGVAIAEEWQASVHQTQNGAGCADCHEPDAGHPNLCNKCHGGGGFYVVKNPDLAGKCYKCHGLSHPADVMVKLASQHFGNMTANALTQASRASYVSSQYQQKCTACHNPHKNNLTQNHKDYAKSLHGNVNGKAWASQDFKQKAQCIRCHTSTGFLGYINGFALPAAGFGAGQLTREVLACNGCHSSYDFKNSVRRVAAFPAPYKVGGTPAQFPDAGTSNLCIPCHAGRDSADAILAVANFSNAPFVDAHQMAVAGLMYMKIGFKGFTTASAPANSAAPAKPQFTYGASYTMYTGPATPAAPAGQVNSAHRRFGTPLINGDTHTKVITAWIPGTMDTGGPCVTCHLNAADSNGLLSTNARTTSHTLAINTNTWNQVCANCHAAEAPVVTTEAVKLFLEENSDDFQHALTLAKQVLQAKYNIKYTQVEPYFYDLSADPTGNTPVRDWTRGTNDQTFGRRLMGACFNINLLANEPAAYAHARTYARRLIYDSIDFLDDGTVNMSVGATALAQDSVTYVKGATTATSSTPFNYLCNLVQPERK